VLLPVGPTHFMVFATLLFSIGMYGALARRNAVAVLLSIELMFNAAAILLVTFSRYLPPATDVNWQTSPNLAGQIFAIFIITVAAADAAVGLAIVLAVYRLRHIVQVDQIDLMKG
jgi:NADH:ubiquinone oxidoreductase subunit K